MGAKKIQPTEYETALALVAPFASADPARTHIALPFYADLWGKPYVCATDGHTAAAVACAERVARSADIAPPPPLSAVIPEGAERVGFFKASELEGLRGLPAKWQAIVSFDVGELPRLSLTRVKGSGRTEKRIKIVEGAALPFANTIDVSTAFNVEYLLRAVDFCGVEKVTAWRIRGAGRRFAFSEQEPVIFTCGAGTYAGEAARVAIVMPCRK